MNKNFLPTLFSFLFFIMLENCSKSYEGVLEIRAPIAGEYELFKMSEAMIGRQFISEKVGKFNQPISLPVGSYLVLADCSNRSVVIRPNSKTTVDVQMVQFHGPDVPFSQNSLSLQCVRNSEIDSRQVIQGRFYLNIISDKIDLLVGTKSLQVDLKDAPIVNKFRRKDVYLAALQVDKPKLDVNSSFFVFPQGESIASTQVQRLGDWLYLVPGEYEISLNGTNQSIKIGEGEKISIVPSVLRFSVSDPKDVDIYEEIRGRPFSVVLNDNYPFYLNEDVAVLAGQIKYRLADSRNEGVLDLEAGSQKVVPLHTTYVRMGCSPWEWECLGRRNIRMYFQNQIYSTVDSITDVPTFYELESMSISLEGSYGLKRPLAKTDHTGLKTGELVIVPYLVPTRGAVTEFMRLESTEDSMTSYSRDIPFETISKFTLISGQYYFSQYLAKMGTDDPRPRRRQTVDVVPYRSVIVKVPIYLSEQRVKKIEAEHRRSVKEFNAVTSLKSSYVDGE